MGKVKGPIWFAMGLGIGVGATYLFSSRRGRRLRRQLYRMAEQYSRQAQSAASDLLERKPQTERSERQSPYRAA